MNNYTPVSCDLYDQLEAIATLKQECTLTYKQENGQWAKARGRIVDVYAADGADWCKLNDDTVIRLAQIEEFESN